jgi:hypothetical protein
MRYKFVETTALMRNIWNDQFRILGTFGTFNNSDINKGGNSGGYVAIFTCVL